MRVVCIYINIYIYKTEDTRTALYVCGWIIFEDQIVVYICDCVCVRDTFTEYELFEIYQESHHNVHIPVVAPWHSNVPGILCLVVHYYSYVPILTEPHIHKSINIHSLKIGIEACYDP